MIETCRYLLLIWMMALALAGSAGATVSEQTDIDTLLRQANDLISTDPGKGEALLDQVEKMSDNLTEQQAYRFQILKAKKLTIRGQYSAALDILTALPEGELSINSQVLSNSIQASVYSSIGKYNEMFAAIGRNLNMIKSVTDLGLKSGFLHPAIVAFRDAGAYDDARQQGLLMLELSKQHVFPRSQCFALVELGITERAAGNLDAARRWLLEAERYCAEIGNALIVNSALVHLAGLAVETGQPKQAIEIARSALPSAYKVGYILHIAELNAVLADAYFRDENPIESLYYGEKALAIAEQHEIMPVLRDVTATLSKVREAMGDYLAALQYMRRHLEVSRFLADDRSAIALAFHRSRYKTLDKERQIQILNQQNELLALSKALGDKQRQNLRLMLGSGIIAVIILACWLFYTVQQRRKFMIQAQRDGLTGVASRSYFMSCARNQLRMAHQAGKDVSLILFDLDYFKAINDTHGHSTGDWVLRKVAQTCRNHIRKSDLLGRIGGEEFAICMLGATLEDAAHIAENCRKAIKAIDLSEIGHSFQVTASFGVSSRQAAEYDLDPLMVRADNCLYDAKNAGRDQLRAESDLFPDGSLYPSGA